MSSDQIPSPQPSHRLGGQRESGQRKDAPLIPPALRFVLSIALKNGGDDGCGRYIFHEVFEKRFIFMDAIMLFR